jgi:hypothetical protein
MSEPAKAIDDTKKPRVYLHTVEVDITNEETAAHTQRLLDVLNKIDTIEADKASRVSDFNSELKQLRKEAGKVRQAIKVGKERREVEVYDQPDERRNIVFIVRASDNKVLDERAMTLEDRMHAGKSREDAKKAEAAAESPSTGTGGAANDGSVPPGKANAAGTVTRIKASRAKKKREEREREAKEAADKARAAADAKDAENATEGDDASDDEDDDA